jgi:hypothetical protein
MNDNDNDNRQVILVIQPTQPWASLCCPEKHGNGVIPKRQAKYTHDTRPTRQGRQRRYWHNHKHTARTPWWFGLLL